MFGNLQHAKRICAIAAIALLTGMLLCLAGCGPQTQGSDQAASSSASAASSEASSSAAAEMAKVPNVVALSQDQAEDSLADAGFKLGKVTEKSSETVEKGKVISQKPAAQTELALGKPVSIVVSTGKPGAKDVKVPDLKGKGQDHAKKLIEDAGLVPSAQPPVETNNVDPGIVFKQSPSAGTTVKEGTTVEYTAAATPSSATVPDVVGEDADDAQRAIENAGLVFQSTTEHNNTVPKGYVISQSIAAGTQVDYKTAVKVTISLGKKEATTVKVPNLIGYIWDDAKSALEAAGLKAAYKGDINGTVTYQDVKAGRSVRTGSRVTVTLDRPQQRVTVPDLRNMTVDDAQATASQLGLRLKVKGGSDGTVESQSPAAGTEVNDGSTVTVTVVQMVEVPNLNGFSWQDAKASLKANRLKADWTGEAKGNVVDQNYDPGSWVEAGTTVTVTLQRSVEKVTVPDLVGMSITEAEMTLDQIDGLSMDTGGHIHGNVKSQKPKAGKKVEKGTVITITIDDSDFR